MSPSNALALSFRTNLDGSPEFPGVGVNGGTYKGLQFITSNTVTTNVVALQPEYILYADDGGVTIDASTEASLQMDSAPAVARRCDDRLASMFQMNAVALRAERYITWKRVGTNSVKYLTATAWPAPTGGTRTAGRRTHAEGELRPMGVLDAIRSRLGSVFTARPVATSDGWWPVVREPYTGAWQNNDPLTTESALANPSVFGCVSAISADIGKIAPPLLLEEDDDGFWGETRIPPIRRSCARPIGTRPRSSSTNRSCSVCCCTAMPIS